MLNVSKVQVLLKRHSADAIPVEIYHVMNGRNMHVLAVEEGVDASEQISEIVKGVLGAAGNKVQAESTGQTVADSGPMGGKNPAAND